MSQDRLIIKSLLLYYFCFQSSSDEDDRVRVVKKRRDANSNQSPFKVQSHHDLLLQELKRQREKKLAASALHNHQVITRGPERIRVPNPAGGVMIIPKSEMNSTGVLRMAATRELKRKVNPQFAQKGQVVHTVNPTKKDLGLNIIDQTTPGSSQPKTIRIVASSGTGQGSVKQTAENVKVSADGYLIISGKNSGIKVTENTKIVIQPPGQQPQGATSNQPPMAQSPVTVTGNTPDFSQLTGAGKVLTPKPNPGSSGLKTTPASSDTSNSPSVPGTGQQITLASLLKQASGSQILSANEQARLQAMIKQLISEGTMTPEKAKTVEIARRILQLNLQKRKMLQQKSETTDMNTPKVAKFESQTNEGSGSSSLIEQKLREPNVNIDSQLGSVSKNVISNVNIASDILDTYYSVMNEDKVKTSIDSTAVTKPSAEVTQAEIKTVSNVTSASPACQSTVPQTTGPVSSNTVTSPLSSKPPAAQGGSISDVTRLIINLMNKGDTGRSTGPDNQRPATSSTNNVLTQSVTNNHTALSQNSVTASSVGKCPESSNMITNTFSESNSSSLSGLAPTGSVSDLLKSANIKQNDPPNNNVVDPIEALLTSNTTIKSNSVSVSKTSIMEALASNFSGSDLNLNTNQSHCIPKVVTTPPLPEKTERPNLFDSFDAHAPSNILITSVPSVNQSVSVTDAIKTVGASTGNQTASANVFNSNTDEKTIRMKLKADKMPLPSSSTINFGSPLKTTSVLEALKCKLHTLKPDMQV